MPSEWFFSAQELSRLWISQGEFFRIFSIYWNILNNAYFLDFSPINSVF